MPVTTIDKLVIELGLDVQKLIKGQQQALASFTKTRQEAERQGKMLEDQALAVGQVFQRVRSGVISFGSAILGASGIAEFAKQITQSDAALGRLSTTLGTSPEQLSKWRSAAQLFGASAEDMTAAIQAMTEDFQNAALTGQSQMIPMFLRLGIQVADANGKMRPFRDILTEVGHKFQQMDPARAAAWGRQLGIPPDVVLLLRQGDKVLGDLLDKSEKLGVVTRENAEAAQKLQTAWNALTIAGTRLAANVLYGVAASLSRWTGVAENSEYAKWRKSQGLPDKTFWNRGGGVDAAGLPVKPGAGQMSVGVAALAQTLERDIQGIKQFTAFNDPYHGGAGAHGAGRALDFSLQDPSQSAAVSEQIRAKLRGMGIDATVLDEYLHPSPGATGGHIHVQMNNAAAAARMGELGAGTGAGVTNNTSSTVVNGPINITVPGGNADDIAGSIKGALERSKAAAQAQSFGGGLQ